MDKAVELKQQGFSLIAVELTEKSKDYWDALYIIGENMTSDDGFSLKIKIIGTGSSGCNIIHNMMQHAREYIELITINTEENSLLPLSRVTQIQLDSHENMRIVASDNIAIGEKAEAELTAQIIEKIKGTDLLFLTTGMGGATGTWAISAVAKAAEQINGLLTIAIITKPFHSEGEKRTTVAKNGISDLLQHVDLMIVLPCDNLCKPDQSGTIQKYHFNEINDIACDGIKGIYEPLTKKGRIGIDFADYRTIFSKQGFATLAVGKSNAPFNSGRLAAEMAVNNPLSTQFPDNNVSFIYINFTHGLNTSINEFMDASWCIQKNYAADADIIIGAPINNEMQDEVQVTIIATGHKHYQLHAADRNIQNKY